MVVEEVTEVETTEVIEETNPIAIVEEKIVKKSNNKKTK
jgi:hypothetical protein